MLIIEPLERGVSITIEYRSQLITRFDDLYYLDGVTIRDSIGRDQRLVFINDAALYSLHLSWVDREFPCPAPRRGPVPANLKTIYGISYKIYTRQGTISCVVYEAEMT